MEEDNIIVKWAQEDVETSYNLLNKNKDVLLRSHFRSDEEIKETALD